MSKLNILVSTDRNYIPFLKTMLHSLFDNNKDCKIFIHIFHSSLDNDDLSEIDKTVTSYNGVLFSYKIDTGHDSETMVKKTRLPKEAYYRLLCMDYLPKNVKKVIYLDCDIIINGSLKELYNTNMSGLMFAAAEDFVEVIGDEFNTTFRQKAVANDLAQSTGKYVNSGVLLINLDYLRKVVTADEIIDMIEEIGHTLKYHDQDFINFVFHKYILHIDYKMYNYFPIYGDWDELRPGTPVIIHFAGPFKPWEDSYFDTCEQYVSARNNRTRPFVEQAKDLYEKYAAME